MMKKFMLCAVCLALCAFAAFAEMPNPQLVPDYNRDGKIDMVDRERAAKGEAFTIWLNDDDDDDGTDSGAEAGDTNNDLHDVPSGKDSDGNPHDKDFADDHVNGRCDLLDFFPVLIDVNGVDGSGDYTWKLISPSVNVVFTQLKADTAGDFHTKEAKALDDQTPLYEAEVKKLAGEDGEVEVALPDDFLKEGRGVILVEGAALGDEWLTLRGEREGSDPVEMTLDLRVKDVEDMYGWLNLRPKAKGEDEGEQWKVENSAVQPSTFNLIIGTSSSCTGTTRTTMRRAATRRSSTRSSTSLAWTRCSRPSSGRATNRRSNSSVSASTSRRTTS